MFASALMVVHKKIKNFYVYHLLSYTKELAIYTHFFRNSLHSFSFILNAKKIGKIQRFYFIYLLS